MSLIEGYSLFVASMAAAMAFLSAWEMCRGAKGKYSDPFYLALAAVVGAVAAGAFLVAHFGGCR